MKSLKTYKWIMATVLLLSGCSWFQTSTPKKPDEAGVVTRKDLVQRVTITGQLAAKRRLDVKPRFAGYIVELYVKVGDRLKLNDPVVTFSPSLGAGETNFPVRAAFAGTVTQVLRAEGEYLLDTSDQNLVARIEDLSELSILATVPELDVAKVKVGQEAQARVSAIVGESFPAVIREISMSARDKDRWSSSSTEFQIKGLLKSHDKRLLPGMSAMMDIETNRRGKVLALAHEFIFSEDGKYYATLLNGERRELKLGLQTDDAAEIIEGLSEGDRVKPVDFLNLKSLDE
jgi:multidrug efflux pump subunit AcrA (membrane-fusion protein)